jgi:hypothetical protein
MRLFASLSVCILVAGFSIACLSSQADSPPEKRLKHIAVNSRWAPVRSAWRIGAPVSHEKLTVYPVLSDEPADTSDLITLDEGLRAGNVTITELGADGRSRAIGQRERLGDGAEVNKLALTNNSGKMLVLIAGEMLIGGKQDRIVGHDCIVASTNKPIPLDVFCVEHGRWSDEASFGPGRGGSGGGLAVTVVRGGGGGGSPAPAAPPMAMASPSIREKAEAKKSQHEVWAGVAETVTVSGAHSSTGDLKSVYNDQKMNDRIEDYSRALKHKVASKNIIGVVIALGGRITTADVFANSSLFQAYWPKMLKSYAAEAIATERKERVEANLRDAENFLSRVEGSSSSEGQDGVYRLTEHQSGPDASFELEWLAKKPTLLVHFNRVTDR